MEIERKYLFDALPLPKETLTVLHLTQGYISRDPVIRVRQSEKKEPGREKETHYILTVKGRGKSMREELELELEETQFQGLIPKVSGKIIEKYRALIPLDPACDGTGRGQILLAEADEFQGSLSYLRMVEVEFPDEETMNAFKKPDWFGKDVTEDAAYQNSNLSKE